MKAGKRSVGAALYANCGDLIVSFSVDEIARVLLGQEVSRAPVDRVAKLGSIPFEGQAIPAWDLGELLSLRKPSAARVWIIASVPVAGARRLFALGCDDSIAVRQQLLHLPLPPGFFSSRPGAVIGAFATSEIREAGLAPTGFALSASHLLAGEELQAIARAADDGKLTW
ncbi:MAG: hypothetical protein R3B48_12375 [Kofleriaceae bacterium]